MSIMKYILWLVNPFFCEDEYDDEYIQTFNSKINKPNIVKMDIYESD